MSPAERRATLFLLGLAAAHVPVGLALPLLAPLLDPALLPHAESPEAARFWVGIFGPTVASWGVLASYIVQQGIRRRQRWACEALLLAVLVWAPLDTWLCWQAGFGAGIALDAAVVLAFAVPALWLRRRF